MVIILNKILPQQHEKYMQKIRQLRPMDDIFMNKVFEDRECVRVLLETVLEKTIHISRHEIQKQLQNLQGHSSRLDMYVRDEEGNVYDIEIQISDEGADPKRARYYSSLIDGHLLMPRQGYSALQEKYVIFIVENDVLGQGLSVYHINRTIEETGIKFKDGEHIIYVNGSQEEESKIGRFMHDLHCKEAKDMYNKELRERVRYFKEEEEGIGIMCEIMEEIRREGIEEGVKKGKDAGSREKLKEIIKRMLLENLNIDLIAKYTGLTVEEVKTYI